MGQGRGLQRLVCIVEGHGETRAVPKLCARILHHAGAPHWYVDDNAIRHPRADILDLKRLERAVDLAKRRPADAVLVLCDADDDCPRDWGPAAAELIRRRVPRGEAVMAVREFEAWPLWSLSEGQLTGGRSPETIRDAKGELRRRLGGSYSPTVDQLVQATKLDIDAVRARSDSFDKLVRAVVGMCGGSPPPRASAR